MESIYKSPKSIYNELFEKHPELKCEDANIWSAYILLRSAFLSGNKLLIAGNGGSASDADHISGELLKSFKFKRKVNANFREELAARFVDEGQILCSKLENGIPAIPLPAFNALMTAYGNDTSFDSVFAQMTISLGQKDDVLWGITTSGNSEDIYLAFMAAKASGLKTLLLTGNTGGKCKALADVCICVPEKETYLVQELHLPVYHALCAMVEAELFEPAQ